MHIFLILIFKPTVISELVTGNVLKAMPISTYWSILFYLVTPVGSKSFSLSPLSFDPETAGPLGSRYKCNIGMQCRDKIIL